MSFDKSKPVSVVIPAHNEERYLANTIQSIDAAFAELGVEHELIVVNDASTDDTVNVAKRLNATVVDVELRNIGAVRNAGAERAIHKRLIFVDADTIVPCATIRATLSAFDAGVIAGGARVSLSNEKPIPWRKYWIFASLAFIWQTAGNWAAGCYMYCTAESFRTIEGFPEEYFAAEEFFFSRKMKKLGKFKLLNEPVVTSARKLHDYTVWELLKFLTLPFLTVRGFLKTRNGLELLYEYKRD